MVAEMRVLALNLQYPNDIMKEGLGKSLLFDKNYWIVRHLLFWSFIYLDELFNQLGITEMGELDKATLVTFALDLFLVYVNIYILIPRFLTKGQYVLYALLTFIQLALVVYINDSFYNYFYELTAEELDEIDTIADLFHQGIVQLGVLFPAIAIKLVKNNWSTSEQLKELNQLQYEAELDKLKKQVNPHFLFNSLNAIYIQAKQKSDKVPESIMSLSNLMRYQTYDALQKQAALTKELAFLTNYLEMEKMRRDNFEYRMVYDENDVKNIKIEPLLLLPLVENACKYSVELKPQNLSYVNLAFKIANNKLRIDLFNNIGNVPQHKEDKYSGLGQSNVRKRLNLLYPDAHRFQVVREKTEYHLMVSLDLKNQK